MTLTRVFEAVPAVPPELLRSLEARIAVPGDRPRISIEAPFTEEDIGSVPAATAEDVARAVQRARRAQEAWSLQPVRHRSAIISRFHDLLLDHSDVAIDIVQLEAGKARVPAFEEVFDTAATSRYYVNTAPGLLKPKRRAVSLPGLTKTWEFFHPVGVVGNITPWNFPFTLSISDIVAALLAGNAVVIKPDEKTPYSALYGSLLLEEAGLPNDVIQVVTGFGEEAGAALVDEVDFVMFTGSTEVGRTVSQHVGRRLIPASMELGGKNAAIILPDADLDRTVPGVSRAVFANGGQLCLSMERVYVHESIRQEFTARFVDYARSLPLAVAFDYSSDIGALIDREHLEKVDSHVQDALVKGAHLLTGGKARPDVGPLFYEPTILEGVDDSMILCRAETFGPVVSIYGFESVEDAILEANDSDLGLNYSVWTRDTKRGVEIATRLRAGTVGVNDGYAATWSSYDAPMGGMKASGISRRHGAIGLLKYTESQTVSVQRLVPAFAPPPGMSYDRYSPILRRLLKILKRVPFYK